MLLNITLLFLSLPSLLFFLTWLRFPFNIIFTIGTLSSLFLLNKEWSTFFLPLPKIKDYLPLILIIIAITSIWVIYSGAGGFWFQTEDYGMHNGRLQDLINYSWPVIYPQGRPLVYYSAYYLPAALLGKLTGFEIAYRLMYFWTLGLVLLAISWLFLCLKKINIWILLSFIFFSGMSAIGAYFFGFSQNPFDAPEWWAFKDLYLVYQSVSYQLFWAPHQVIMGWILTGMIVWSAQNKSFQGLLLLMGLTCFWSPFIALAFLPLLVGQIISQGLHKLKAIFTLSNIWGIFISLFFLIYFLSGSATHNAHGWIWQALDINLFNIAKLLIFYLLEFLLLFLLARPALKYFNQQLKILIISAVLMLLSAPVFFYGTWNDLVTRGITVYLWLIYFTAVYFLIYMPGNIWQNKRKLAIVAILIIGALTPWESIKLAYTKSPKRREPISAPDYKNASQFLGNKHAFFYQFLAKP